MRHSQGRLRSQYRKSRVITTANCGRFHRPEIKIRAILQGACAVTSLRERHREWQRPEETSVGRSPRRRVRIRTLSYCSHALTTAMVDGWAAVPEPVRWSFIWKSSDDGMSSLKCDLCERVASNSDVVLWRTYSIVCATNEQQSCDWYIRRRECAGNGRLHRTARRSTDRHQHQMMIKKNHKRFPLNEKQRKCVIF